VARAGGDDPRLLRRAHRASQRPPSHRLRGAVVGVQPGHQRDPARPRDPLRPLADAPRRHPVLRARRRLLDPDRLRPARRDVDEAPRARPGDRPRGDPGELVPRRPAADDVHQGQPEQPRLRQPARHRADVARPVRLDPPRVRLRGLHDDDPPRRLGPPAGAARPGAAHRAHQLPRRRAVGDVRRDRPGLRRPLAAAGL
ncbi:MAG: Putative polysaccharide deacetylase, partial [uncultured Actinomycetospora sp.]